jgi:hypothetical protein
MGKALSPTNPIPMARLLLDTCAKRREKSETVIPGAGYKDAGAPARNRLPSATTRAREQQTGSLLSLLDKRLNPLPSMRQGQKHLDDHLSLRRAYIYPETGQAVSG